MLNIDRLIESLPKSVAVKGQHVWEKPKYVPRDEALAWLRIQVNQEDVFPFIALDVDRGDAGICWEDCDCPPNWCMRGQNGHAHYLYLLDEPLFQPMRNGKAQQAYRAIQRKLTAAIPGADPSYNNRMVKTPGHADWLTTVFRSEPYSFEELNARLEGVKPLERVNDGFGRNRGLFDALRHWAYQEKAQHASRACWMDACLDRAHMLNEQLSDPMGDREVAGIGKSVGKWTWARDVSDMIGRGIMDLDPMLTNRERMAAGAQYVHQIRRDRTLDALISAYQSLIDQTIPPTQVALAAASGISLSTVKRHWSRVREGVICPQSGLTPWTIAA
jgi:hypothetical protein